MGSSIRFAVPLHTNQTILRHNKMNRVVETLTNLDLTG